MNKIIFGTICIVVGVLFSLVGVYQHRKYKASYSDTDVNSQNRLNLIVSGVVLILGGIGILSVYFNR